MCTNTNSKKKVDFGYQEVNYEDKEKYVGEVFHKVASNYDLMNDVSSLGIHRLWKKYFVSQIGPMRRKRIYNASGEPTEEREPMKIIDVAGGTGDIAFTIYEEAKRQRQYSVNAVVDITVSDINSSMLGVGQDRARERGYHDLKWLEANAESIPQLEDGTFDLYTIAFGIRNVTDRPKMLREAHRVLKRGGRFM
jgi:demethylmenaquinone methyltransferase/2-methoxy-6-polyprenyl-1,4-benzoquinol methylase